MANNERVSESTLFVSKVHLFVRMIYYWYFTAVFSIYTFYVTNILYINLGWIKNLEAYLNIMMQLFCFVFFFYRYIQSMGV